MVAFRLRFKPGYIFVANGHVARLTSDLAKAHPPYSSKKIHGISRGYLLHLWEPSWLRHYSEKM